MDNIMKCARCGKLYKWRFATEARIVVGIFSPRYGTAKHDLCDECTNYLKAFMNGAKVSKYNFIKGAEHE